jgi:hypothetical protein
VARKLIEGRGLGLRGAWRVEPSTAGGGCGRGRAANGASSAAAQSASAVHRSPAAVGGLSHAPASARIGGLCDPWVSTSRTLKLDGSGPVRGRGLVALSG